MLGSALLWSIIVGTGLSGYYWWRKGDSATLGDFMDLYLYGALVVVGLRLFGIALFQAATHQPLGPLFIEEDKYYIALAGAVLCFFSGQRIRKVFNKPPELR